MGTQNVPPRAFFLIQFMLHLNSHGNNDGISDHITCVLSKRCYSEIICTYLHAC